MSKDYKTCREVYYNCMDEFCANKDSQLKRCACSSRLHEFDDAKKQLSAVEDQLLDFNQRLLTVNMDKEDAAALYKATEGELAFAQKDTSDSKKLLDEIASKLKTGTAGDSFNNSLAAISLSLNMDAAFDSVDSLMGASTTAKEGTALYQAALPICLEMAREVCDDDALSLAESGYQMAIEQDCNTVAKTYETQTNQAREKIREGGALLDMSRLDIYQKRNSDDILTCKKKMLNMLTDSTVCGTDLGKCLDTTGRYIDPSTGEAFLTVELAGLGNLITRPGGDQTWTSAPGNDKFVSYLNTKKKYLAPAMENCQSISDQVWDEFIEDALAQIKLAQESKLEDMRQSCTTLTAQCLSDTAKSLSDFDARALSTFGVSADKTVNEMCANVRTACTALLETTGGDSDWVAGVTEIATNKTYDTIMQTCREVGRACIIQACKSISGNFGLCEDIQTSVNRKSIINRTSCWNEVVQCVAEAGSDKVEEIMANLGKTGTSRSGDFYSELYSYNQSGIALDAPMRTNTSTDATTCMNGGTNANCVYDICANCGTSENPDCNVCRLAEKIWGNCEFTPTYLVDSATSHNYIKIPNDTETLLSWFAVNTGTSLAKDSCRDTTCGIGFGPVMNNGFIECVSDDQLVCNQACAKESKVIVNATEKIAICCSGDTDSFGNCCPEGNKAVSISHPTVGNLGKICVPDNFADKVHLLARFTVTDANRFYYEAANYLVCLGDITGEDTSSAFPAGQTVKCDGQYVVLSPTTLNNELKTATLRTYGPLLNQSTDKKSIKTPVMSFKDCEGNRYIYKNKTDGWHWFNEQTDTKIGYIPAHWEIEYPALTKVE